MKFGRENRLRSRADFERIYRQGQLLQSHELRIFVLHKQEQTPRLGIAISRRVGGAVKRNRIKRAIREGFRLHKAVFVGTDTVVQPKVCAGKMENRAIQTAFLKLYRRVSRSNLQREGGYSNAG
ncbi:MAG: ribonuclease P protein component [Candidatus Bipolaricaulia bacterium]